MSKYTTELRYICEALAGEDESVGYDSISEVITKALPKLFDFDFPIFDEAYRQVLERKIVKHYYTREICAETVGLWKLYLDTKLNEIMPYYNQLYTTELISYNPLYDIDLHREHSKAGNENGSGSNASQTASTHNSQYAETGSYDRTVQSADERNYTGSSNMTRNFDGDYSESGENLEAYSDTPNNKLSNVTQLDYLTTLTKDTYSNQKSSDEDTTEHNQHIDDTTRNYSENVHEDTQRNTSENATNNESKNGNYTSTVATTESYIENITGSTGGMTYAKKISEFRKNILNIDMMIINELSDLFFGLW